MIAESFKSASYFVKLLFIVFSILIGFVVSMVLGIVIAIPVFGIDIQHLLSEMDQSNPENIPAFKFLQSVYSIGLFVFPPIMVAFFFHGKIGEYLRINKSPLPLSVILVCLVMLFSWPFVNFMVTLNEGIPFPESLSGLENAFRKLEEDAQIITSSFLLTDSFSVYLVNIAVMAVIPAIGEEFLFRGIFQRLINDWSKNAHIAIWASAFLFSAIHMQFFGFIPRLIMGAFFGYLFIWSGNLWLPIAAHFANNAYAVTIFYVNGEIAKEANTIGTEDGLGGMLISSIFLIGLLGYIVFRLEKEKRKKQTVAKAEWDLSNTNV